MSGIFGGGGGSVKVPNPTVRAENRRETAGPASGSLAGSEAEQRNKRLAASMLTADWGTLTLGKRALLGRSN